MRVKIENYDSYYDRVTKAEFRPVLDRRTGLHVGLAEVDERAGAKLLARPAFHEVTDEEYLAMTQAPATTPKTAVDTGDPLADEAKEGRRKKDATPPPPPPGG